MASTGRKSVPVTVNQQCGTASSTGAALPTALFNSADAICRKAKQANRKTQTFFGAD
jgi:hypothetical protein